MGRGLSELQKTILQMAYENRQLEWEPRPVAHRVLVLDRAEDTDLRALVPEAFERFQDGYWKRSGQYNLVAGSFEKEEEAKRFSEELKTRGLRPYCWWTVARVATEDTCDLFSNEVYCEVYGMRAGSGSLGASPPAQSPPGFPRARIAREWANTHTDDEVANYKNPRHGSARAAVSRAFARLDARGLVERAHYGICLTERGLEVAERANG